MSNIYNNNDNNNKQQLEATTTTKLLAPTKHATVRRAAPSSRVASAPATALLPRPYFVAPSSGRF